MHAELREKLMHVYIEQLINAYILNMHVRFI